MGNTAKSEKQARNAAYAHRFKRRDRSSRKAERRSRVEARELAWLTAMGIERDLSHPIA